MDALNKFAPYTHWLVRLSLAGTFIYHGALKIPGAAMMAEGMGMPIFMIYILGLMEVAGGLLVLWGGFGPDWATQVAGLIFAVVMVGAIMMVHFQHGWNSINMGMGNMGKGMEFQVLILVTAIYLFTHGNKISD